MTNFDKFNLQIIIIIGLIVIGGVALFGDRTVLSNYSNNQLELPKQKWNKQAVKNYRLILSYSHFNCQQDLEIKDEKIVTVRQNNCATIPGKTVTDLFGKIESLADGKECGPNGCACDGPLGVNAIYDAKFGYPRQVEIKLQPEKRWQYFEYWQGFVTQNYCTLIGFNNQKITVVMNPIQ
jgi:hypothetical protein